SEFGLKILGEKWVNHHGQHKKEGTRSVPVTSNGSHEIMRGVGEIFATTDVYGIANLDPHAVTLFLRGEVTETLDPSSKAVAGKKNDPQMPLAWLREYTAPDGKTKGQAFCTTMGASVDFDDEDLRRLIVNTSLFLTGQKLPAKGDVAPIDPFTPSFYSGLGSDHYKKMNRRPEDYALGKSPATSDLKIPAVKGQSASDKAAKKEEKKRPDNSGDGAPHAPEVDPPAASKARPQAVAAPAKGERIVLIGNGLAERDVYYSRLETELHLRFPASELFFRNMGKPGDTPGFRPHPSRVSQWAFPGAEKFHPDKTIHNGKGFFPTPDQWLHHLKADTVVAFFGYNESFDGQGAVANYQAELEAFVQHTLSKAYNGKEAPRLVLVSPIAYENQSAKRDLPNGEKENANLSLYAAAMQAVAKKYQLTYIDLFTPTKRLYETTDEPFTTGGFIPTEDGYRQLAELLANGLYGETPRVSKADPEHVHAAVKQKDWFWNNDYNILNGVHTHGQRYNPFGPQNYPDEVKKSREMAALRDQLIRDVAAGKKTDLAVDDSKTHPLPSVVTNYQPSAKNGSTEYLYGEAAEKSLTVPEGYQVKLFASEKEFPNLANPMQLSFDDKGRLWVAVMPTYPHYRPGDALPDDKLLIYEDTDGDGRADKETVFADKLHLPIGFEFAPEGVYVSQEPNLVLLRDTNGDDKADSTEIILGGFDTHDTHHAISAYTADPSGAFILCEGVFLHTNVETPYGPVRAVDGGFYRYSPQRMQLERTAQLSIPNPWGAVFDQWGQDFFLHTSGPSMNWMLPVSVKSTYGSKTPSTPDLVPKGQSVRPTSGLEIVSSRHFPDAVQGDIVLCNAIGFLGIKQHQIEDAGTGYKTTFRHDLLKSTDGNFRPVDLEFAPDGSLYVIDWHNVLIGHMQHNARDPLRDHVHGRIYRITYPSRPLVQSAKVAGATVPELLENLKLPEMRARYRSRRALRAQPLDTVLPAVKTWVAGLDKKDPDYERLRLEALWVTWGMNAVDEALLRELLASPDFHVRAAAVRVVRYNHHRLPDHAALLEKAAADPEGRVRLEATVAASWIPDKKAAMKIVEIAAALPTDEWSKNAVQTAKDRLAGVAEKAVTEHPVLPAPAHLSAEAKKQYLAGQEIYFREGLCVTCHQPNGKGLDPAFPSIEKSPWVTTDAERLIKITLYGLMGPIEVNGRKYDGQVPMTPFGGMLKDPEIANVLTFVRNSFGNQAEPITAEQVKKVRDSQPGRLMFYTTEELLKEHPMK
ncbi:MAG: dehydrogenase, partial [Verrucomicrobia bacterium]|nr:dehydrogenase [Verrucomicrobiota bacterium]